MEKTRICAFGDSAMKGTVLESESPLTYTLPDKTFTDIAAEILGITIDNYASFGSTVAKGEKMLIRHFTKLPSYDYALLKFGGNDCDFYWPAVAADPSRRHEPLVPLTEFSIFYEKLIGSVRAAGPCPVVVSLLPLDAERYFRHITRDFSQEGRDNVLSWLGKVEFISQWHDMYGLQLRGIASECGAPFIDIAEPLRSAADPSAFLCEDGVHPNAEGQALMAGKLASELRRIISAGEAEGCAGRSLALC